MTDKSKEILAYLKDHYGEWFSKYELVEALDTTMAVVNGSVQGLLKKGMAESRTEEKEPLVYGSKQSSQVIYVTLTPLGMEFDPEKEEERKAREHLEARAAAKAERARAKAERAKRNAVL